MKNDSISTECEDRGGNCENQKARNERRERSKSEKSMDIESKRQRESRHDNEERSDIENRQGSSEKRKEDKRAEIVLIVEVIGVWEGGEGGDEGGREEYGQIIRINLLVAVVILP